MHFVQTRIATIDVYGTFFIMLMYLFMFKYRTMSFYDTKLSKTLVPLGLCGISMGLGIASKWTAVYASVGLAVIFFLTVYRRYREYLYAKEHPADSTDGISHQHIIDTFTPSLIKTLLWCCLFFIVIPLIIYGLSYIPYVNCAESEGWRTIFKNQSDMLNYHGKTVVSDTHPYSSKWYEWLYMKRPIFYFDLTWPDGLKSGISSFGNPLLWWAGLPAVIYMGWRAILNKDRTALFLLIGYLASLIPWIPIERTTFIYHYFPCVPFLALMLGHTVSVTADLQKKQYYRPIIIGSMIYAALAVWLFFMFYPVLSGKPVTAEYVADWLRWMSSWVLVID